MKTPSPSSVFLRSVWLSLVVLLLLALPSVTNAQGATVNIRVRSAESPEAIQAADVTLVLMGRMESSLSGYTDSSGRATLIDVRTGTYEIVVKKEGYETARERVFITGSARENFFIQLKRKAEAGTTTRAATVSALSAAVPETARKTYDQGVAALKEDPGRSIDLFKRAIEEYPKFAEAYMMIGYAQLLKGEKTEALTSLGKAIELDPKLGPAHLLVGKIYLDDKKLGEAEKPLRDSVGFDPLSWEAHFQLARVLYNTNKLDEAFQHARRALELPGASPLTHLLLVDLHMTRNQRKEAIRELEAFAKADPSSHLIPRVKQMIDKLRAPSVDNRPPESPQPPGRATPMNP